MTQGAKFTSIEKNTSAWLRSNPQFEQINFVHPVGVNPWQQRDRALAKYNTNTVNGVMEKNKFNTKKKTNQTFEDERFLRRKTFFDQFFK